MNNIDHLKPYEPAARKHCELTGVNPDMMIPHPHPKLQGVMLESPAWLFSAERLFDLSLMLTAMKLAAAEPAIVLTGKLN